MTQISFLILWTPRGIIKIYTSGCQRIRRCWYNTGSPPAATSKKLVLIFLSNNNIVNPEANTGNDNNNNTAVINIDQLNNVNLEYVIPLVLIFITVTIKFIAPNNDEIPDICNENIIKSTDGPDVIIKS